MSQEIVAKEVRKLPTVIRQTGLTRGSIYRLCKSGDFPKPVKLGVRASGWIGAEVDAWIESRIASRDAA